MSTTSSLRWRIPLLLAGVMILAGPQHPRGSTMLQMLGHADWLANHLLMTASLIAFGVGLVLLRRGEPQPERTARWLRYAIIATALQTVEAVVHTAAVVDHGNLAAGRATPVLTTHLAMAVVLYPLFGAAAVGLIVAAARERVLGSWWIAWIGIIGRPGAVDGACRRVAPARRRARPPRCAASCRGALSPARTTRSVTRSSRGPVSLLLCFFAARGDELDLPHALPRGLPANGRLVFGSTGVDCGQGRGPLDSSGA
jgi:hypothetical protein